MKITKRQLKRIIREAFDADFFSDREANPHDSGMYGEPEGGYDEGDLEARLNAVWDKVGADTMDALGGQATWEEIADEVLASGYSIDPDLVETINLLPFAEQQRLFQRVFGSGRRY